MDIAIVGASVSGLFSAYLLARGGMSVSLYERFEELGHSPRTLIVTNKINEALGFDPHEAIINKVKYLELFSPKKSARLELRIPDLVIERTKLLKLLGRLAERAGAKMIMGHQFSGFTRRGEDLLLDLIALKTGKRNHQRTDALICAHGRDCAENGSKSDKGQLASLIQARVSFRSRADANVFQVYFAPDQTRYFYWLIPESEKTAVVGVIADEEEQAVKSLELFLQRKGFEPLEFQASPVPLHRFQFSGYGQIERNVFLVGDAAAQVKVTTVGGVLTGLLGAKSLANALLNGGNYRRELKELKRELDLHLLLRSVLNQFTSDHYDELISLLSGNLKNLLEGWTRDELRTGFTRLMLAEPRLISLGAKAIFKSILDKA